MDTVFFIVCKIYFCLDLLTRWAGFKGNIKCTLKRYYVSHEMMLQLSRYMINTIVFTSAEVTVINFVSEVFARKKKPALIKNPLFFSLTTIYKLISEQM